MILWCFWKYGLKQLSTSKNLSTRLQINKQKKCQYYQMQATEPEKQKSANSTGLYSQITTLKIRKMLQNCKLKTHPIEQLPQAFHQFMKMRGLNINQLAIPIPRYVRVKPNTNVTTQEVAKDIGITLEEIVKVDDYFWALNPQAKINRSKLYQNSILYGMDYSSAIPVQCLDLKEGLTVLQLCSAPGNKSMLMADSFQQISIKGVEISHNRANIMKNLIKKYKLQDKIEVIQFDGLKYKSQQLFDRVLVDAECTHEGSLKHIFKFFHDVTGNSQNKKNQKLSKQQEKQFKQNNSNPYTKQVSKANQWSREDFQQRFLDAYKLSNLNYLQSGLLQNGFQSLKPGGIIVYSTCSFDQSQNQTIIANFLDKNQDQAQLLDASLNLNCAVGWKQGTIKGTLRFSPSISYCGGMFIAKLHKKLKKSQ